MKFLIVYLFAVLLLCSFSILEGRAATPQTYAVIIGVSTFQRKGINTLNYAQADAQAYYKFLRSPQGGGVPEENISYLPNEKATRALVVGEIRRLSNLAGPEDVLIVYISTHGVADPRIKDVLYFAMYDTDPGNFWGTALEKDAIVQHQRCSVAKIKLLFTDACHSGGSGISLGTKDAGEDIINRLQASQGAIKIPSYSILAASSSAERSYEDQKWGGGHGVFTHFLLKGLSGEADKKGRYSKGNNNGIVTLRELYDYLYNVVPLETGKLQHPEMQSANPDVIPISAVGMASYAKALDKAPRLDDVVGSEAGPTVASVANPALSGFEADPNFASIPDYEAFPKLNSSFFYCMGKAVFLNSLGEGVILYRGICTTQNVGETKNVINIGNGRKGMTETLMIGTKEGKTGDPTAEVSTFKFYFATSDPSKPRRYGTISLPIRAGFQTQIALDKENLILTTTGERDRMYAGYAGLN